MAKPQKSKLTVEKVTKITLFAFAVSIPFDRLPSVEIYGFTARPSGVVGLLLIVLALRKLVLEKPNLKAFIWPASLLIGFTGWSLVSLLQVSSTGNIDAALHVMLPMLFLISVALAIALLLKKEYLKLILQGLFLGTAVAIVFGFYQFAGNWAGLPNWLTGIREEYSWQRFGFPRMQSTALEPLYFGAFLLLPIAILAVMPARNDILKLTKRYYLLLAACLLAVFLTLSRGALMAVFIVLVLATITHLKARGLKIAKNLGFAVLGILITFALAALLINLTGRSGNREDLTYNQRGAGTFFSHLTNFRFTANQQNLDKNDSIGVRQKARNTAFQVMEEKRILLLGTGPGQYETYVAETISPQSAGLPNNLTLELILQFGLPGMLLFYGFFGAVLWKLAKNRLSSGYRYLSLALAIYFVALLAQAQVFSGFSLTHLWFAVGVSLFLIQLSNRKLS